MSATTAKTTAASTNTLRAPKAVPIQIAIGQTSIWAAVWAVVIQAPSSKPACTAPRMSASPKLDRRVLSVEMNVPNSTPVNPSQGMVVGAPGGGGAGGTGAPTGGSLADRSVAAGGTWAFIATDPRAWRPWPLPTC